MPSFAKESLLLTGFFALIVGTGSAGPGSEGLIG